MKIFLYTSVLFGGGAERVLCALANNLYNNPQNEVFLIASYKLEEEYFVNKSIKKIYIDKSVENKNSIKQIVNLRKLIKQEKPDVIISFLPKPNFKILIASFGLKSRKIISIRNDPKVEYSSKASKMLCNLLYPMADGVVFQTEDAKNFFSEKIQKKSEIIMNQVDDRFFETERISEDYYVATGRLKDQKNYDMMINSFSEFIKECQNEKLFIYGYGTKEDEYRLNSLIKNKNAENNIFIKGVSTDVPRVLSHAKAFLMCSNYEGMPNGLLEAMAVGLPCISTDCPCGGPKTVIEDGIDGILVPVGDEAEFTKALLKINNDKSYRDMLGDNAKKKSQGFKPEIVFKKWRNFIKNMERKS